jgi:hypothetical protein
MAHLRVTDGGDGFQLWRVAANILNKQSWAANKGWSSSLGVGRGANKPSPQKTNFNEILGIDAGSCKHGNEPSGSTKGWEFLG